MYTSEQMRELYTQLDARYVQKDDCEDIQRDMREKIHIEDRRLTVIEYQQKINNWLTLCIAAGIVALVIKVFLGG